MAWKWNTTAARYYDTNTGKFLSRARALEFVDESLAATENATGLLSSFVSDGMISAGDWRMIMREEIKREYVRQACLAKGGRAQMTPADWGRIGQQIKEQYKYLDSFAEEVAKGKLTEAQIRSRSSMYVNSALQAFEGVQEQVAIASGYDEESWHMNPALENCPDCEDFYNMGWQPIGTFPTPCDGSTVCLTSCGCHKEYRNSQTGDIFWGE